MTAAIAVAILLVLIRQFRARAVRPVLFVALPTVLVGLGAQGLEHQALTAPAAATLALGLVVATAFGVLRGRSERVWRAADGTPFHCGTLVTGGLWLATAAARIAAIGAARALGTTVALATELELVMGASLAAQFAVVAWRAGLLDGLRSASSSFTSRNDASEHDDTAGAAAPPTVTAA